MRFKITLSLDKNIFGNKLPLSYQYELSAFVYRTIARADEQYSAWLHENGFRLDGRQFKLFTFSHFKVAAYKIIGDRLQIDSDTVTWFISFLPQKSTEEFVRGIFSEQVFQIGDKQSKIQMRVKNIEMIATPDFTKLFTFKTLSPVCIGVLEAESGKVVYVDPSLPEAVLAMQKTLISKYIAYYGIEPKITFFEFKLLNVPKPKLISIKAATAQQTRVRGFEFGFMLRTSPQFMEMMYETGLGEKSSMGFGCVEPWENF